jgi:8-oxo-dGTP diphosphatase
MIDVTCAVIRNEDNEILIVQRGEKTDHPFKWEFPGGKTTREETPEECIIREVSEELSMDIVICGNLLPVEYDYGHKQIRMIPFICDTLDELPLLAEHLAYRWLPPEDLINVDFSEADILVANQYVGSFKGDNESVQRSFLRILSLSNLENLNGRHHGLLADYSFAALNSGLSAIAIKAYTMEILYKLSLIYPELANELASSIRILMEDGSAGIIAKGKAVLKRITEIPLHR